VFKTRTLWSFEFAKKETNEAHFWDRLQSSDPRGVTLAVPLKALMPYDTAARLCQT